VGCSSLTHYSLDPSQRSRPAPTSFPGTKGIGDGASKPRHSLDADAFKRLMLTGQTGTGLDCNSTDTSSISRQSLFEPIPESANAPEETPRTSHELDDDDRHRGGHFSGTGTQRPKPPPPKPRNRSGSGRSPAVSPSSSSTEVPTTKRPPSISSISSDKPPPPPPPPVVADPTSPSSILTRKIAPDLPLSRRHSVQSHNSRPSTPSGGKMPPPPPPIRRHKSTNTRTTSRHEVASPVAPSNHPPPPPPPPRRNRTSTFNSVDSREEALSQSLSGEAVNTAEEASERDILVDLEKLQREVDELRGKYEGKTLIKPDAVVG
jgi:hypothetical protein